MSSLARWRVAGKASSRCPGAVWCLVGQLLGGWHGTWRWRRQQDTSLSARNSSLDLRRLQAAMCVRAGLTSQLQLLLLPFLFSDFFYLFCCGLCTCKCRITGSVRSVITLFCGHVLWALGEWKRGKRGSRGARLLLSRSKGCDALLGPVGVSCGRGGDRVGEWLDPPPGCLDLFSTQTARPRSITF